MIITPRKQFIALAVQDFMEEVDNNYVLTRNTRRQLRRTSEDGWKKILTHHYWTEIENDTDAQDVLFARVTAEWLDGLAETHTKKVH